MKMTKLLLPIFVLLGAAAMVFGTSKALKGVAEENQIKDRQYVMEHLLPGCKEFSEIVYEGEDTNIVAVYEGTEGFIVETKVAGYVDDMTVMVGVNGEGVVTGLVVMDMAETFGLGQNSLDDVDFLSQFLGTNGNSEIGVDVDGISGATVTSKALAKAVNSASAYVTGVDISSSATEW